MPGADVGVLAPSEAAEARHDDALEVGDVSADTRAVVGDNVAGGRFVDVIPAEKFFDPRAQGAFDVDGSKADISSQDRPGLGLPKPQRRAPASTGQVVADRG